MKGHTGRLGPVRITFSETWDKLREDRFTVGSEFSTWRPDLPTRIGWHKANVGKEYAVLMRNGHVKGRVLLLWVGRKARRPEDFTDEEVAEDTHEDWGRSEWLAWLEGLYGSTRGLMLRELRFRVVEVS